jgi:DNA-binding NarL/FixJ family response regulator
VLLVEDVLISRLSLKTTLRMANLAASNSPSEPWLLMGEAEDGLAAIAMVERLRPQLVLMDIGLPKLDGIQATRRIRQQFSDVQVMMLTSHEEEAEVLEAFQAGATSYCLKDAAPEAFLQALSATALGDSWIDPRIARIVLQHALTMPGEGSKAARTASGGSPSLLAEQALTEREVEVLRLITEGLNNTEMAERLCISMNTVKTHLKNIFMKLEVADRTAAALKALKEHLV